MVTDKAFSNSPGSNPRLQDWKAEGPLPSTTRHQCSMELCQLCHLKNIEKYGHAKCNV